MPSTATPKRHGWYRVSANRDRWYDGNQWTNQYRRTGASYPQKRGTVLPLIGVALLPVRATVFATTHVWL